MKRISLIVFSVAALVASAPVWADKPSWAGGEKHGRGDERMEDRQDDRHEGRRESRHEDRQGDGRAYFSDDARRVIVSYYGEQGRAGKCPPGLAKKHNGCLPPGQAKKWQRGYPLPADLRYYSLPRELLVRLPPPPPQHRYVQVAGDILMIAVGSSMVADAVEDILR